MLAFAKDISQTDLKHPEEDKNSDLKQYMDYQRQLDHERIVYHALDRAKTDLQQKIQEAGDDKEKLSPYLKEAFLVSHRVADPDTVLLMLRKLINGHNSTNNWYRMNAYYYALVYDCLQNFVKFYNQQIHITSAEKEIDYDISGGAEIDFDDWVNLYFPDLDFYIGNALEATHYPFSKRNKAIENDLAKETQSGKTLEQALQVVMGDYEIDETAIRVLLNKKITPKDLELFYTSVENPIYEYLNPMQEGQWGLMDGESLLDHAYYLGSQLKVWAWRKREDVEQVMDEFSKIQEKKSPPGQVTH
ncbi:MAG: hypothetical protein NPINA01_09300 [Nitrospinaceae bacterium]|nr:MAG: hypothetical protein NPINA01_09300 [Nitrospinaceae bacterium]